MLYIMCTFWLAFNMRIHVILIMIGLSEKNSNVWDQYDLFIHSFIFKKLNFDLSRAP